MMFFPGVASRGVCCVVLRQGKRIERRRSISVSSLRTQGPIATSVNFAKSVGHLISIEGTARYGSLLSQGRRCGESVPRTLTSPRGERSRAKRAGEGDSPRALLLRNLRRLPLTPTLSPQERGEGEENYTDAVVTPPSTTMVCPVMKLEASEPR